MSNEKPSDVPDYLLKCKKILETRYREQLVIEKLASELGVSNCHLCHAFTNYYQVSPYAYLTEVRMKAACKLLCSSHMPIREIAAAVGYSGSPHFCATFRRCMGTTPNRYRRMAGNPVFSQETG